MKKVVGDKTNQLKSRALRNYEVEKSDTEIYRQFSERGIGGKTKPLTSCKKIAQEESGVKSETVAENY